MPYLTSTPTVSSGVAYSSGDSVGGKVTLAGGGLLQGQMGLLNSLLLTDVSNQKAVLEILLFDSDPTAGTYTDNAALALSTDLTKIVARIPVAAADYVTIDSKAVAHLSNLQRFVMPASGQTSLFMAVLTTGTPTYTSVAALQFRFGIDPR